MKCSAFFQKLEYIHSVTTVIYCG